MSNRISIAVAVDDAYIMPLYVMLFSVLRNTQTACDIFVLQQDLKPASQAVLQSLLRKYPASTISFLQLDATFSKHLPPNHFDYITKATFYRLALPAVLPKTLQRVIYLDCDLIVEEDIAQFWKMDLAGKSLGAVAELFPALPTFPGKEIRFKNLGLSAESAYFNAGVLICDLEQWRNKNWSKACLDFLYDFPEKILFDDQDALNAVLQDDWQALPARWNITRMWFRFEQALREKQLFEAAEQPAIIHFTTQDKPWQAASQHPYRERFFAYWQESPLAQSFQSNQINEWENNFSPHLLHLFQLTPTEQKLARWMLQLNEQAHGEATEVTSSHSPTALAQSQQELEAIHASLSWRIGHAIVRLGIVLFGWIPGIKKRLKS